MLKQMTRSLVVAAGLLAVASAASALPVVGAVAFGSLKQFAPVGGSDLSNNTGIDFANTPSFGGNNAIVNGGTGDFAGLDETLALFHDFTFAPLAGPTLIWDFTANGSAYAFTVEAVTVGADRTTNYLTLTGTGYLSITGAINRDATPAAWTFTGNQNGGVFSFSASNAALPIPEPTSFTLGSLGLVGLALCGRRRHPASRTAR